MLCERSSHWKRSHGFRAFQSWNVGGFFARPSPGCYVAKQGEMEDDEYTKFS